MLIGLIAFVSEYLDSGLGMGYGTALAPILILMGYDPKRVIPAILVSQLCTDIAAVISHHRVRNVDFGIRGRDMKIALLLGLISAVGVILSVFMAIKIPGWVLTLYIGLLVTGMGVVILATTKKNTCFSWRKIVGISFLASFNKGISGGGYGPLVMGGQLLCGVSPKNAVGITAFAEAITCLVGFTVYYINGRFIDWTLIWQLTVFATLAVPFAALTVKYVRIDALKKLAGALILILGLLTLLRITPR